MIALRENTLVKKNERKIESQTPKLLFPNKHARAQEAVDNIVAAMKNKI